MGKSSNADIFLVIILAVISLISILTSPLNQFPLRIIPCILLLFILPGYSLLAALYPVKERITFKKRLLTSVILSFAISLVLVLISIYTGFKLPYTLFIAVLSAITLLMVIIAYKRRRNFDKNEFDGYVICEKCGGYYKLKKGESIKDFKHCQCGGNLKYIESEYIKPKKAKKDVESFNKTSQKKQLKIESPEYKDVLLVIIITCLSIIAVTIPFLNNSIIRMALIAVLAFLLSGYSLSVIIFPLSQNISKIKRIFYSVIFSLLIILPLYYLNLKTGPITCIMTLSILTVSMIMLSFVLRLRSLKKGSPETEVSEKRLPKTEPKKVFEEDSKFLTKHHPQKPYKKSFIQLDLLLVLLTTILCAIFVTIPPLNETSIRNILGLLFVLFVPGYSLTAALFPKGDDISNIERFALSFGLSIAVTVLIGVISNYTAIGIKIMSVLLPLLLFTTLMILIAYIRRLRTKENERFTINFRNNLNSISKKFRIEIDSNRVLSVLIIISIILAISTTIYVILTPKTDELFTEFYILGPNGKATDYPTNLTVGQMGIVNIRIVNYEHAKIDYKLIVKLNNQTIKEENIVLSDMDTWENKFSFTVTRAGEKQKLEFILYKLPDKEKIYRSLHLWINVK